MEDFDTRPQLDRDLHMGKIMWAVNKAMGKDIFETKYVKTIQAYVKRNPKITVKELLKDEDYSPIEACKGLISRIRTNRKGLFLLDEA